MGIPSRNSRKLIALAVATLVVGSLPVFGTRFLNDTDFYTLFADKLLSGRLLYRDALDTKPPLVFLHYALVFKLFGWNNLVAVKVVTMFWLGLSATFLVALQRSLSSAPAVRAALAAPLFLLASFSGWGEDFLSSNTEVLANLFIVAGVWALVARDFAYRPLALLGGGSCIGIACLFRYHSGAVLLAYAATMALPRHTFDRKSRRFLLVAVGAALPSLLFVAYYAHAGTLADLRLLLAYQAHYVGDGDAFSAWVMLRRMSVVLAGQWPIVLLAGWQIGAVLRKRSTASRAEVFQVLFAASSLATFFIGGRFFPHYFIQSIPPLILLATDRLQRPRAWLEAHALAIMVGIATLFTAINGVYYWTREPPPSHPALTAFVEAHSTPSDEVLLWAWRPELLLEARRVFATRLLVNEVLIGRYNPRQPAGRGRGLTPLWPVYLRDLAAAPPKLIFDALPGESAWPIDRIPELSAFLTDYSPCQIIEGVCVYLRRSPHGAVTAGDST